VAAAWLLNLLLYRPGPNGFSRYVERVVPRLQGRRLSFVPVLGDNMSGRPQDALLAVRDSPRQRLLQQLSLAQHGLRLKTRLSQPDCSDLGAVYSPYCDYLFAASNLPQVITCHDLIPLFYPGSRRAYWRYRLWTPVHLHRADHVIAISRFVADQLVNFGLSHQRITVVPNGIEVERQRVAAPQSQDWLVLARHDRNKNLGQVIQAYGLFLKQHPHWGGSLVVVGQRGRETATLNRMVRELSLQARVEFVFGLDPEGLMLRLRSAYALISSSLMEGFDYPVLEAKAEGIPTLISDIPVHCEWHHDSSLLFPCGYDPTGLSQAMGDLVADQSLWRQLSQSGYSLVKQLSLRHQISLIQQVMAQLVVQAS